MVLTAISVFCYTNLTITVILINETPIYRRIHNPDFRLFLNMREETDGIGSWGRRASGLSVVATPDAGMDSSIRGRTQVLSNRGGVSRPEGFLVTEVVIPAVSRSPKP